MEPISRQGEIFLFLYLFIYLFIYISRDLADPAKLLAALPSDEELREAGVVINI